MVVRRSIGRCRMWGERGRVMRCSKPVFWYGALGLWAFGQFLQLIAAGRTKREVRGLLEFLEHQDVDSKSAVESTRRATRGFSDSLGRAQ